jgi:hypothetical protein
MAAPQTMLSIISSHKTELEQALGADAPAFFAEVTKSQIRLQAAGGNLAVQASVVADLVSLINRYPAASRLLLTVAPAILTPCDQAPSWGDASASFHLPIEPVGPGIIEPLPLPDRIAHAIDPRSLDPGVDFTVNPDGTETAGHTAAVGSDEAATLPESAPIPRDQTVQRYADVQAPASVATDTAFTLTVALTRQPPADQPHLTALSVRVTDTAAGPTGAPPVMVLVYATAFQIDGPTTAQLHIYLDKDSEPANFSLRPKPGISGPQQISVTFIQGGINIVGRVLVQVEVGGPAAEALRYSMPLGVNGAPGGAGPIVEPDVILWVDRLVQNGRDYLKFRYMWPQKGQRDPVDADPPIELNQVQTYAQDLYTELSKCAAFAPPPGAATDPGVQSAVAAAVRELQRIGANLYEQLFPQPLKDFYKQFAPEAHTLLIYSSEPWIPWEIILPNDPTLNDQYCEFLCARFQVTRWLIMDQQEPQSQPRGVPATVRVHAVCPITPPVGLSATQDERTYLGNLPQTWPPLTLYNPLPRTAQEVLNVMTGGQVNLFHFATHGQFAIGDPGESAIIFSADGTDRLTPKDIFDPPVRRGLGQATPFVFVNACHSGRQGLALAGLGGWVDKLLRYGCSGFLGSNWEVADDLAAQFAVAFYESLHAGQSFGLACLTARQKIRAANPGNSTWLAYVLYAHPLGMLTVQ